MKYYITDKLGEICNENQYFVNLRSDVFMIVTEYTGQNALEEFIHRVDDVISSFKDTELHFVYGVYTVEDRDMELRQMEDRAAMARKAAKKNLVTSILFYKEQFKELLYTRKFIEESMKTAVTERQFQMYLQPKYSIARNGIVGAKGTGLPTARFRLMYQGFIYRIMNAGRCWKILLEKQGLKGRFWSWKLQKQSMTSRSARRHMS